MDNLIEQSVGAVPASDPANVAQSEDPEISDTDSEDGETETDDEGPSSSKRVRYCSPQADCGTGKICGPINLGNFGKYSNVMLGIVSQAVQDIGNCISDPFSAKLERRWARIDKRAPPAPNNTPPPDYTYYGTPGRPHLGVALIAPICNRELYGNPKTADCHNAVRAMEQDYASLIQSPEWEHPTTYFGPLAANPGDSNSPTMGFLSIPRTYQCGMFRTTTLFVAIRILT